MHFGFERIQGSPAHNFLPTVTSFKCKNSPAGISPHKRGNLLIVRSPVSKKDHEVAKGLALQKKL